MKIWNIFWAGSLMCGLALPSMVQAAPRAKRAAAAPTLRKTIATDQPTAPATSVLAVGANDDCVNAQAINAEGLVRFDNGGATKDGLPHAACMDAGQNDIDSDVWFCWTSPCTGPVEVTTCNLTTVDTRIAVYDGCACPGSDASLISCNDDDSSCQLQSKVTFDAATGQSYLVRLGTFPGVVGGVGDVSFTCLQPPCQQSGANCQTADANLSLLSDRNNVVVADNFTPSADGDVTNICWWGAYTNDIPSPDTFEIKYYTDNNGLPGMIVGQYSQALLTLTVEGPVDSSLGTTFPVFEYSATHAPLSVIAGDCYWVEITNVTNGSQFWFWQSSLEGDNAILVDGAPDLTPPDPVNGYDAADASTGDMAFCVDVPLADPLTCPTLPPPPPESICDRGTGDCCDIAGNASRGCNDPVCCTAICQVDEFCCNGQWDKVCAVKAATLFPLECGCLRACCLGDGSCQDLSFSDCQTAGGTPSVVGLCAGDADLNGRDDACGVPCPAAASGDCCANNSPGTNGCTDTTCCDLVCACDPFCCNVAWDDACATGGTVAGCGADLLCADTCAPVCPDGTVTWADMSGMDIDGVVDARQSHTINDAAAFQGIDTIVATGPLDASTGCWSLCETGNNGTANSIASVVDDGAGNYTITLARPITGGELTQLSYTSDTAVVQSASLVSHPANVNGDSTSNSSDIIGMVDCCLNGICSPMWGKYSCDLDQSGIVNASDLTRLIDLLNGANAFDPWLSVAKTTGTCP